MTRKNISEDLDTLIFALENGYSGSQVISKKLFDDVISRIDHLRKNSFPSPAKFCEKISDLLNTLPDNHLSVSYGGRQCSSDNRSHPTIFKNMAYGAGKPWVIQVKGKSLLIGLTRFPAPDDPVWDGFLDQVAQHLSKVDWAIIDLRGNSGGFEQTGRKLAALFWRNEGFPTPVEKIVFRRTPTAHVLFANVILREINRAEGAGKEVASSLTEEYLKNIGAAFSYKSGVYANPTEIKFSSSMRMDKGPFFQKKLFILTDKLCESAGEMTIDYFEYFPGLVRVGQNTAGRLHFGNVGLLVLPYSQISIRIPGYFVKYRDNRFIEKKGIAPHIRTTPEQDALQVALKYAMANS